MKKEERICGKCNSMKTARKVPLTEPCDHNAIVENGEDVDGSEVEVQLREQPINRPDVPSLLVVSYSNSATCIGCNIVVTTLLQP